uniref:Curli production assembly/transport component CsgE n=1 Tax=Ascaris lumbricoides TaxID=6252 RepID=A0A0M3IME0_ASCLU
MSKTTQQQLNNERMSALTVLTVLEESRLQIVDRIFFAHTMRQEHATDEVGEQNTLKGAESSDLLANFRINTVSKMRHTSAGFLRSRSLLTTFALVLLLSGSTLSGLAMPNEELLEGELPLKEKRLSRHALIKLILQR